jgi:hypothetical protein
MELTLDLLKGTFDILLNTVCPVLWYGTSEGVPRDTILYAPATKWNPEYIAVHPDDLDSVREGLQSHRQLKHLREWKPQFNVD